MRAYYQDLDPSAKPNPCVGRYRSANSFDTPRMRIRRLPTSISISRLGDIAGLADPSSVCGRAWFGTSFSGRSPPRQAAARRLVSTLHVAPPPNLSVTARPRWRSSHAHALPRQSNDSDRRFGSNRFPKRLRVVLRSRLSSMHHWPHPSNSHYIRWESDCLCRALMNRRYMSSTYPWPARLIPTNQDGRLPRPPAGLPAGLRAPAAGWPAGLPRGFCALNGLPLDERLP